MVGKKFAIMTSAISIAILYFATTPFEGMNPAEGFVYQLGRWGSWSIQTALLSFWLARVLKKDIGKILYASLILSWTVFYSYSHYTQGMSAKAVSEEMVNLIERRDIGENFEKLGDLAPTFMQLRAVQRSQDRLFAEFQNKQEQLNIPDVIHPRSLFELEGRDIARNKLHLLSEYIDSFDRERIAHIKETEELIKELGQANKEFSKGIELG